MMGRVILILLLSFLFGCNNVKPYPGTQPSFKRCHALWGLGYEVDWKKCEEHCDNPKFKYGEIVALKGNTCTFQIGNPSWSGPTNKPAYLGVLWCKDPNGKFEKRYRGMMLEKDMKKLHEET